jgi:hypothetical protein
VYVYNNISLDSPCNEKHVSDRSYRGNENTNFIFNSFFPENRTVYEITWENMVQPVKPQKVHALYMPDN